MANGNDDDNGWVSGGRQAERDNEADHDDDGFGGHYPGKSRGELGNGRLSQIKNHNGHNEEEFNNEYVNAENERDEDPEWRT